MSWRSVGPRPALWLGSGRNLFNRGLCCRHSKRFQTPLTSAPACVPEATPWLQGWRPGANTHAEVGMQKAGEAFCSNVLETRRMLGSCPATQGEGANSGERPMDTEQPSPPPHLSTSNLFMVRLWFGEGADGWRAEVRHVLSGETRYFESWQALIKYFRSGRYGRGDDANGPATKHDSRDQL